MLIIAIISVGCVNDASAQSAVYVIATSDGGEFDFTGDGKEWNWDINVEGFDNANVDLTNNWVYSTSTVKYENIGDGEIHVKVSDRNYHNEWMYYDWDIVRYDGNGLHIPKLLNGGGRSVNVTNSPNVTTYIEQVVAIRKAVFLMDTRHSHADLVVCVHNGHLLENATVELAGGPRAVKWTDENGEAEFSVSTGKYAIIINADGFNTMIIEDLTFESQNSYHVRVNMTNCLSSSGSPTCAPDSDALIMYYKQKEPNMGTISPQEYVNYFANRLTTCMAHHDKCAVDTLERMSSKWGIYPDPKLGVLLYSCNFTKLQCDNDSCEWRIEYEVRNFQYKSYNYTVSLIVGDTTTELNTGVLGSTYSTTGRETGNNTVIIDKYEQNNQMYLAVMNDEVINEYE